MKAGRSSMGTRMIGIATVIGLVAVASGSAQSPGLTPAEQREGWKVLFDGVGTAGWTPRAAPPTAARGGAPAATAPTATWVVVDGALTPVVGDGGRGHLVSNASYGDFVLRMEFWVDRVVNSGVFIRAPQSGGINSNNAYEVNIYDAHNEFPTGSINNVQKTMVTPQTVDRWNTLEITAQGDHLVVMVNGQKSVDARNGDHARGPFGLQALGRGTVKFRNIRIREF